MAGTKISALTPAASVVGDELIPAVQDGGNVSLTPAQIAALATPVSVAVYAADKTALDAITDQAANALGLTLDTATLYLWDDTGEAWVEIGPLKGDEGDPGPAIELQVSATHVQWRVVGAEEWTNLIALADLEGSPGSNGNTILSGAVDPTDEGVDGDFFLNTATSTLFGPKASGTWPAGVLLKGADGTDGEDAVVPDQVSTAEIEAGTETDPRLWSPADVVAAIDEHAEGGGATTLAALTDVDLDTAAPTDGQALVWDDASETWIPGDAGGSGTIGGSTGATDNAILRADGTEGGTIQAGTNAPTYSDTGDITIKKDIYVPDGSYLRLTSGAASIRLMVNANLGIVIVDGGGVAHTFYAAAVTLNKPLSLAGNVTLQDAGANALAQRNGINAQESQVYGAWRSTTDYQRLTTKSLREAITAASGATLVSTITIPKFTHLIGITTRVTTALGTSNGTTGYQVGDGTDPDLWGDITGTAAGTTSDAANFTDVAALGPSASDRTITLTAVGGNFDGTGVIEVCAFYLRAEAD